MNLRHLYKQHSSKCRSYFGLYRCTEEAFEGSIRYYYHKLRSLYLAFNESKSVNENFLIKINVRRKNDFIYRKKLF